MSDAAAAAAPPPTGWYYLGPQSQPVGPYDGSAVEGGRLSTSDAGQQAKYWLQQQRSGRAPIAALKRCALAASAGLAKGRYITRATLLWRDGLAKWEPLSDIADLAAAAAAALEAE